MTIGELLVHEFAGRLADMMVPPRKLSNPVACLAKLLGEKEGLPWERDGYG